MENTTRGYRFPGELEPADIAPYFQDLATDVNDDVQGIADQLSTGQVGTTGHKTTGIGIAAGSGFSIAGTDYVIRNGWMNLTIVATRTGSTITAPSSGNIADTVIATLADHRPSYNQWALFGGVSTSGSSLLDLSGVWHLLTMMPTSTIGTGDNVRATFIYTI